MKEEVIKKYVKDLDGLLNNLRGIVSEIFIAQGVSENMVIFIFGTIFNHLKIEDIMIKDEKKGELDAWAELENEEIVIEFQVRSKDFLKDKHDPNKCDLIVCWKHNWEDCPSNIDVLELKYFWEEANPS
jgi:hypothetical protein